MLMLKCGFGSSESVKEESFLSSSRGRFLLFGG